MSFQKPGILHMIDFRKIFEAGVCPCHLRSKNSMHTCTVFAIFKL